MKISTSDQILSLRDQANTMRAKARVDRHNAERASAYGQPDALKLAALAKTREAEAIRLDEQADGLIVQHNTKNPFAHA